MSQTIVILGASGFLGRAITTACAAREVPYRALGRNSGLDVTSVDDVHRLAQEMTHVSQPVIVNCAAVTDVEACETDPEVAKRAWEVNAHAPAAILHAMQRWAPHVRRFVQISTGGVFEGVEALPHERSGFDEFSTARPVTAYSRSKWAGEELLRRECRRHTVIRVSHLYGFSGTKLGSAMREKILGKKFEKHVGDMREPLAFNGERSVSPSYVRLVAERIVDLIVPASDQLPSILHVAPSTTSTWYDFACHMATRLGLDPYEKPRPIEMQLDGRLALGNRNVEQEQPSPVYRPKYGAIVSRLSGSIGTVDEGLDAYLEDMRNAP